MCRYFCGAVNCSLVTPAALFDWLVGSTGVWFSRHRDQMMDERHMERRSSDGTYGGRGLGVVGERDRGRYPRNGRGRPRERERERERPRGRGKGDYPGSMPMKTPVILANPSRDKRQDGSILPGSVSIMQRESSGSHLPSSPPLRSTTPAALLPTPTEPLPPSPHHPQPIPYVLKQRYDKDEAKGRLGPQRKLDGLSSSPSSYTPLQPSSRAPREREGGVMSRTDHSVLLGQSSEMSHCVKLVDKSWHWEDRGVDSLLEQSDFLVVGVLGKQGVGKSTIMSLLAGTRTGSGKPYMFRTQSKEVCEGGGYQTTGVDMVVTGERIVLLDAQPILSEAMLEQFLQNEGLVPPGMNPETHLELLSLQLAVFLYTVCHVVVVVLDNMDSADPVFRFLCMVEQLKPLCVKGTLDLPPDLGDAKSRDYLPQLVFVLNHATADDFQPQALRDMHSIIADSFHGSKTILSGGMSLLKSGIIPIGRGFPSKKASRGLEEVDPSEVNLHLLPTAQSSTDNYGAHCASRPEKQESGLNPLFSLMSMYVGYPSAQLLSENLRNQIFAMPRLPLRRSTQQQLTEREWFDYARRIWLTLKKSDLASEYEHILQSTPAIAD